MKNINWEEVQKFYNNNHFWRDIIEEFKISNNTILKAVKNGHFKTRSRSESIKLKRKIKPLKLSEETKNKISISIKKYLQEHPDKVPYLLNHSSKESYPENYFEDVLQKTNLKYKRYYQLSIYQLDFAFVDKKIDLEIDGSQHYNDKKIVESDKERTEFLNQNGWETIRINWSEYQKMKRKEKEIFVYKIVDYIKYQKEKPFLAISKTKIDGKYYCDCGNTKSVRSNKCLDCYHKNSRKVKDRPNKEELLQMIKEMGYEAVGRKYNVSGKAVKKWLK